jgi:hypothetical protein
MAPDPANLVEAAGEILTFILSKHPHSSGDPVRDWDEIFTMANFILKRASVASTGSTDPAALSTLGMRQKVWCIFVKYFVCWHFTGTPIPGGNAVLSVDWDRYVHAFHAPLDRRILNSLERLPVGAYLRKFIQNGNLRQTDGTLVPWSKLEDSATWWAFQRLMRRLASVSFPDNEAPNLGKEEPSEFADAVDNIPVEVLIETLQKMSPADESGGKLLSEDGMEDDTDAVGSHDAILTLERRIEELEKRVADLERTGARIAPQQQETLTPVPPSDTVTSPSNDSPTIHLRQTGNSSYIKVLLGKYAANNFALIGRNLRSLSLKKSCATLFPTLWEAFHNLTPKPYLMGGSTPHGGVGYGGTADITKAEAIKLFVANGFSVIDETVLIQGKPTEYHP